MNSFLQLLSKLHLIITKKYFTRLIYLQLLNFVSGILELATILLVAPLLSQNFDLTGVSSNLINISANVSEYFNFATPIFFYCIFSLFIISISTTASLLLAWYNSMFGAKLGANFSARLFEFYINRSWEDHSKTSSSEMIKRVSIECDRVSGLVIQPLLLLNSRLVLLLIIFLGLAFVDFLSTTICVGIIALSYLFVYRIFRNMLVRNGDIITADNSARFQLLDESLEGFKEIKIQNVSNILNKRFADLCKKIAVARGINLSIAQFPKKLIELVIFATILISTMVVSFATYQTTMLEPVVLLGLSGLKILPIFQQLFTSLTQIKASTSALDAIFPDLINSNTLLKETFLPMTFKQGFHLVDVNYLPPNAKSYNLKNLSLEVKKNDKVAIVGPSGSGKTTLVNVITGLAAIDHGLFTVDKTAINADNRASWRQLVAYVPQSSFILNDTIVENIVFGTSVPIDFNRLDMVINQAELRPVVDKLDDGHWTILGEQGSKLSGGEKQRVAIARALYSGRPILVLDEATSSQDLETERIILQNIFDKKFNQTVVIVSHRLASLNRCDNIFVLQDGELREQGSFEELMQLQGLFYRINSERK